MRSHLIPSETAFPAAPDDPEAEVALLLVADALAPLLMLMLAPEDIEADPEADIDIDADPDGDDPLVVLFDIPDRPARV